MKIKFLNWSNIFHRKEIRRIVKIANAPAPSIPVGNQWTELLHRESNDELIGEMLYTQRMGIDFIDIAWPTSAKTWKSIQLHFPDIRSGGVMGYAARIYFNKEAAYAKIG